MINPINIVRKTNEIAIISLFTVIIITVLFQVVSRYVFNSPPDWSEELARYCQVWMVLLTSSICIRKGTHLAVDYLTYQLNDKWNKILGIICQILIVFYVSTILFYGFKILEVGEFQFSTAMEIKMWFVYLIFPIGYSLMLIEALIALYKLIRR